MSNNSNIDVVYFVGTCFENPISGGMIYNSKIANELFKKWKLIKVDYPWRGYIGGLIFDLNTCKNIIVDLVCKKKIVLFYDESLYQRMPFTLFVGLFCRKLPIVLMCHQLSFHRKRPWLYKEFSKKIEQIMVTNANAVVSAGDYMTSELYKLGCEESRVKNVFATCQFPQTISLRKDPGVAVFVGSVVKSKGVFELIRAVNVLRSKYKKDIKVYVAGDKSDSKVFSACASLIKEYGVGTSIIFLGRCSAEELSILYKEASLFVFPSYSETMSMALIEAMSAGCIPIVFNNSSMPYLVRNGITGWVANDLDVDDFSEKIFRCLVADESEIIMMRFMASLSVQKYVRNWQEISQDIENVIMEVMSE